MASSDNLMALDPWALRSGFADPWFADMFSRETETPTKVLQKSFSDTPAAVESFPAEMVLPVFNLEDTPVGTPSASGPTVSGGSENETAGSKRRNVGPDGKIKKRKSRASKRTITTYITADAAHFRQMVQQVTGFKFGGTSQLPAAPILKPEPHRAVHRLQPSGCLPTLDTSAFLLDQSKQQQQTVDHTTSTAVLQQTAAISPPPPPKMEADASCASAFDFEFFSSFPTLESWKTVM